jgi:adenine-specific DNA-methyltransferase
MMRERIALLFDLLSDKGSLFVHCDWHVSYLLRCLLDERFGSERFMNEIVWYYYNKFQGNVNRFASNHDVILWYSKSPNYHFKALKEKRAEGTVKQIKRKWDKDAGRIVNVKGEDGKVLYQETDEKTVDDVWRISMLQPADKTQNVGYPTQKPDLVLERIIEAASAPGDLVADFFCGSGTTLAVAERLNRRWIGCDLGRWATHVARKRLLGVENCNPFEVLNLGKYERQYWQGVTFGAEKDKPLAERALYEYLAFILKLYRAQPLPGMAHLHGKKAKALVHIGAVDAPVTIGEINAAVDECAKLKQSELHVLGWEWEMGLYDLMVEAAKKKAVKLLLLQIPREVMEQQDASKGDVRFFELAYLEAEIKQPKKLTALVALKDFVIPNTELIPEEVRSKVKKWSDYIDYWAVDWDFQNDTFMQGWVAYRTRKERKLLLTSDPHTYEKAGKHRILVKVIDIFGNDTSQAFDVEVK